MTTIPTAIPARTLDVSHLPESAFDTRAPLWWGNLLLILVETTTVAIMIAVYFYVRRNFSEWPPPRVNRLPILYGNDANPDLGFATADLVLTLLSCGAMIWVDRRARKKDERGVKLGLWALFVISSAIIVLHSFIFPGLKFSWDDNAYGSTIWTTMVLHLTYVIVGAGEFLIMALWITRHGMDEKHAVDVTIAGVYWYWVALTWVILYAIMFIGPWVM